MGSAQRLRAGPWSFRLAVGLASLPRTEKIRSRGPGYDPGSPQSPQRRDFFVTASRQMAILGASLGLFLVLLPLGLEKPGLPIQIRADEPTYLAMAASVAFDGDLKCEAQDVDRVFSQFPYSRPPTFHLKTTDGWSSSPFFDRDPLFAWVAALPVRFFGANGLVALNALFFVFILALTGSRRRADGNPWGPGHLFAFVFLFLSAAFVQIFWLGSALFLAFLVVAALRLSEAADETHAATPQGLSVGSGLAFGAAGFALPWLALLMPAFLTRRRAIPWLIGCAAGWMLAFSAGWVLGAPGPFADVESRSFLTESPYETPWLEDAGLDSLEPAEPRSVLGERRANSAAEFAGDLVYSLIERRTGFLVYFPVSLLLVALLLRGRRRLLATVGFDRLLLGIGIAAAVLIQPWVRSFEVGGGAFGNPALVAVAPALLFLLRRPPAQGVTLAGVALGVLTLGPALVSCLGPAVAYAGLQSHTRGAILSRLPLDLSFVATEGDYRSLPAGGPDELAVKLWAPSNLTEIRGDEAWLLGNAEVPLFLTSAEPLDDVVFQLRTLASFNRIRVRFDGEKQILNFQEVPQSGSSTRLTFKPEGQKRLQGQREIWVYPLTVSSTRGKKPFWNGNSSQNFYLGAAIAYLGSEAFLDLPVYGASFSSCEAPSPVEADSEFLALARVRNSSDVTWPVGGAVEVRLGYRWLQADGEVVFEGDRTDLPGDLPAGQEVTTWITAKSPSQPGTYTFELDPIFENVAWFSDRGVETCRSTVQILAPPPDDSKP